MQEFTLPVPAIVREKLRRPAEDHWIICDASEIADVAEARVTPGRRAYVSGGPFFAGAHWPDAIKGAREGSASAVAKSDKLLTEMQKYAPESARRAYIDDVAGATPNVQAYLAGHPLNMRRRVQVRDEYAPLVIAYDPTCSGDIAASDIMTRGVVVLALVRALAGIRPVELYVCGGLDWWTANGREHGAWIAVRIETAPLDLQRAAHYMTAASFVRGILYSILMAAPTNATGGWPYGNHAVCISNFDAIARQAFPHAQDILALPGIVTGDPLLANPRGWLAATMARLGGEQDAA